MKRDYYNPNQAAEYAALSRDSIMRGIRSGYLPTVGGMKVDDQKRLEKNIIKHADLVAWIEGKTK